MARYIGPTCKLARREGADLSLKSPARAIDSKCKLEQKPGQHGAAGARRGRVSDYGVQLREKQKVKRIYGLMETQFAAYFEMAERMDGITGENLLVLLERRLDNVVYRLGFASSLAQARQVVRHGHIHINGKKVTIPSTLVEVGSVISVAEASRTKKVIVEAIEMAQRRGVPPWMALEREQFRGSLRSLPARAELTMPISEKLIVEHYSR